MKIHGRKILRKTAATPEANENVMDEIILLKDPMEIHIIIIFRSFFFVRRSIQQKKVKNIEENLI